MILQMEFREKEIESIEHKICGWIRKKPLK